VATDYCCAATVALIGLAGYCTHLADMLSENGEDRRPLLFNPRIPFVLQGISSLQVWFQTMEKAIAFYMESLRLVARGMRQPDSWILKRSEKGAKKGEYNHTHK
jgi:hypothetical protein